jgi:hypothetical protein
VADQAVHDPDLRLPESRPSDVLREPGFLWLVAFMVINAAAFWLAAGVHGTGFDDCEAMPSAGDRATMAAIGMVAVVAPAALALWKLRRGGLIAALVVVALSGMAWFILVSESQNCAAP